MSFVSYQYSNNCINCTVNGFIYVSLVCVFYQKKIDLKSFGNAYIRVGFLY